MWDFMWKKSGTATGFSLSIPDFRRQRHFNTATYSHLIPFSMAVTNDSVVKKKHTCSKYFAPLSYNNSKNVAYYSSNQC